MRFVLFLFMALVIHLGALKWIWIGMYDATQATSFMVMYHGQAAVGEDDATESTSKVVNSLDSLLKYPQETQGHTWQGYRELPKPRSQKGL